MPPDDGPPLHRQIAGPVIAATIAVALAGLAVELLGARSDSESIDALVSMFSLSYEANVPTWYASSLLLACALLLAAIAADVKRRGGAHRASWTVLAIGFTYLSIDEAVEIHERLGGLIGTGGVLYFDWVIPAAVIVAIAGALMIPLLRDLPPHTRWAFVIAGAVYVGGAVGMELPLGWWTERHGDENLTYALIDWCEECLELAGATLFLIALARRWHERAEADS